MNQPLSPSSRVRPRTLASLLFLLAFSLFLLGNGAHSLWDRDETRFSEATREMIVSRDWVIPHLNKEIRYDKPIMIYWLMSVPMRLWGPNAFSARFTSSLAGAVTVLLVFFLALRMKCSAEGALMAALASMLTLILFCISKAATTDAVLTMTVVAAMCLYWQQMQCPFLWGRHFAFWAVLALSGLVKGPVGPAIVMLAISCEKAWRSLATGHDSESRLGQTEAPRPFECGKLGPLVFLLLRTLAGLTLFLVLALPWAVCAWQQTNGDFLRTAFQHHVVERSFRSFEGHNGSIVYYIPVLLVGTFPLFAVVLHSLRWTWKTRVTPQSRFLLSWFLPGLIMFSLVRTKLPHYCAPLLPSLALMAGIWWTRSNDPDQRDQAAVGPAAWRWIGAFPTALMGVAVWAGVFILFAREHFPSGRFAFSAVGFILAVSTVAGSAYWVHTRFRRAVAFWLCGVALAWVLVLVWALPALEPVRPAKPLGAWLRANAPANVRLMAADYKEAGLNFYCQSTIDMYGGNKIRDAIDALKDSKTPTALVIAEDRWNDWSHKPGTNLPPQVRPRFKADYFLFQRGKWTTLLIVGNW